MGMPDKKNLTQEELLWKIYESTEKTRRYIMWGRILSLIKILVIVVPIILAVIYLPPYIKKAVAPYKELLQTSRQGQGVLNNFNLDKLLKQTK